MRAVSGRDLENGNVVWVTELTRSQGGLYILGFSKTILLQKGVFKMGFMCNQLKLFVLSSEFWLVALGKLGILVLGNKFKVGPFWLGWGPGHGLRTGINILLPKLSTANSFEL